MDKVIASNREVVSEGDFNDIEPVRLKLLLEQGKIAVLTNIAMSILVASVLYNRVPSIQVSLWLALSFFVSLCRLSFSRRLIGKITEDMSIAVALSYEKRYACMTFFSGLVWGMLGWHIDQNMPFMQQFTVPLIMAGLAGGAVYSHMSSILTFRAFIIPMIVPLCVGLYWLDFYIEAAAIFTYFIAILFLAQEVYSRVVDSLNLRFENSNLVADLQRTNQSQTALIKDIEKKETFLQHSFEQAGIPMWILDKELHIVDLNNAACLLFGTTRHNLIKSHVNRLLYKDISQNLENEFNTLISENKYQLQFTNCFSGENAQPVWLSCVLSAVSDIDGQLDYYVMQGQDVSREYILNEDLHYLAHHDALTGLINRLALEEKIKELSKTAANEQHVLSVMDLDLFKIVNEACGHKIGDKLLVQFSQSVLAGLDDNSLLARLDGDEFAILSINQSLESVHANIIKVMETIREQAFEDDGKRFNVTASIGMAAFTAVSSLAEILQQAEIACFTAKDNGRDRIHIYHEDDEKLNQRSGDINWLTRIQKALKSEQLVLFEQTITTSSRHNDALPHREMLIRMFDEDGSIISPGHFLPAAERYNMAASIDLWTVEHVLQRLEQAQQQGKDIAGVYAINLSGQSLGDNRFYEQISAMLADSNISQYGAKICFEVTETAAITNIGVALKFIEEMKQVGCLFALDDFGSGLSSFAYLKELPVDYLKIDGMFVRDCLHNSVNMEIIRSINGIAQVLGLKTIVECVEDEQTMTAMTELGVDYIQGYYFASPKQWDI